MHTNGFRCVFFFILFYFCWSLNWHNSTSRLSIEISSLCYEYDDHHFTKNGSDAKSNIILKSFSLFESCSYAFASRTTRKIEESTTSRVPYQEIRIKILYTRRRKRKHFQGNIIIEMKEQEEIRREKATTTTATAHRDIHEKLQAQVQTLEMMIVCKIDIASHRNDCVHSD